MSSFVLFSPLSASSVSFSNPAPSVKNRQRSTARKSSQRFIQVSLMPSRRSLRSGWVKTATKRVMTDRELAVSTEPRRNELVLAGKWTSLHKVCESDTTGWTGPWTPAFSELQKSSTKLKAWTRAMSSRRAIGRDEMDFKMNMSVECTAHATSTG